MAQDHLLPGAVEGVGGRQYTVERGGWDGADIYEWEPSTLPEHRVGVGGLIATAYFDSEPLHREGTTRRVRIKMEDSKVSLWVTADNPSEVLAAVAEQRRRELEDGA